MTADLLPCPFCGGSAERIDFGPGSGDNEGGSCIACTKCQSSGPVEFGYKENFVSNWNRRALSHAAGQDAPINPAEIDRKLVGSGQEAVCPHGYVSPLECVGCQKLKGDVPVAWQCWTYHGGWEECTKELHDHIKATGRYSGAGSPVAGARELYLIPAQAPASAEVGRDGLAKRLRELISEYWDLAYDEGVDKRNDDTPAGDASRVANEMEAIIRALASSGRNAEVSVPYKLLDDLQLISEGVLPDGDGVDVSTGLWAENWLRRIAYSGRKGDEMP